MDPNGVGPYPDPTLQKHPNPFGSGYATLVHTVHAVKEKETETETERQNEKQGDRET